MIKTFLIALILNCCLLTISNAVEFIDGMEDVPLMSDLQQITKDDVYFGNEETRLIEAYLTSKKINFNNVKKYYIESLPQLGWIYQGNRGNNLLFYRDGETLEVVKESVTPLIVRITIKTKP